MLCPALQPLILSRLQRGPASWTSPQDLPCLAEPICSALNLLRLLLLREQAAGTNHTGVRQCRNADMPMLLIYERWIIP